MKKTQTSQSLSSVNLVNELLFFFFLDLVQNDNDNEDKLKKLTMTILTKIWLTPQNINNAVTMYLENKNLEKHPKTVVLNTSHRVPQTLYILYHCIPMSNVRPYFMKLSI